MRSPGTQPAAAAEDAAAPRREAVSGSGSRDLALRPLGAWLKAPPRQSALSSLGHAPRSSGLRSGPSRKPNRSPPPSSPEAAPPRPVPPTPPAESEAPGRCPAHTPPTGSRPAV